MSMSDATWNLHMMLIRMAKGAIKAWEVWLKATSGSTELPPPSGQRPDTVREVPRA